MTTSAGPAATPDSAPQLYALSAPIPDVFVEPPPEGKYGHYVPHFVIRQMLLAIVGPYNWQLVEILRGDVAGYTNRQGKEVPPLHNAIVGAVYRLTVTIDGNTVIVEEAGECDAAAHDTNDAARLKKASSDAMKRCAMAIGLGINLWAKKPHQLSLTHRKLQANAAGHGDPDVAQHHGGVATLYGQADEEPPDPAAPPVDAEPPVEAPAESGTQRRRDHLVRAAAELRRRLDKKEATAGNMDDVKQRCHSLADMMRDSGLWVDNPAYGVDCEVPGHGTHSDALTRYLMHRFSVAHMSALRRSDLDVFAVELHQRAAAACEAAVAASDERKEAT